jgi:two-component system, cell cycle sensor histidine kinase and response regulator CckA
MMGISGWQLPHTIMVVEDHPVVREFVVTILNGEGYRVIAAEDGRRALEADESHAGIIDLLLSDFDLGDISGAALARQILKKRPEMKVMIMSAWNPERDILEPSWGFLAKPFSVALLVARVAAILPKSDAAGA